MRGALRQARVIVVLLAGGLAPAFCAAAEPVSEDELKAAYVYHFAQLTEWPAGAPGTGHAPFLLCILGGDPPHPAFAALRGKTAHGRRIELRAVADAAQARACDALYVAASGAARLQDVVAALSQVPVLTIADAETPAAQSAIITLVPHEARIGFHINLDAARRSGLRISARLLRLALSVKGAP